MGRPVKVLNHLISYAIRINQVEGVTHESICQWLNGLGIGYIVCFEAADDKVAHPHYHIKCECPWERTKVVSELKRTFPQANNIKGSTQLHSVKETRDEVSYLKYVCKGLKDGTMPVIVGSYGFDYIADKVEAVSGKWWTDQVEHAKQRKEQKQSMRELIYERCKDLPADPFKITQVVLDTYDEYDKSITQVEGLVKLICMRKCKKYKASLICDIAGKCSFEHLENKYVDNYKDILDEV